MLPHDRLPDVHDARPDPTASDLTPRPPIVRQADIRKLAATLPMDIVEFGYSRSYIMLSAIMRKNA